MDEELEEFLRDVAGGGGLAENEVHQVVPTPVAGGAEDFLGFLVVARGEEAELPGPGIIGVPGEGAGGLAKIFFAVAPAFAQGEEFQDFPAEVLVAASLVVHVVVQVEIMAGSWTIPRSRPA